MVIFQSCLIHSFLIATVEKVKREKQLSVSTQTSDPFGPAYVAYVRLVNLLSGMVFNRFRNLDSGEVACCMSYNGCHSLYVEELQERSKITNFVSEIKTHCWESECCMSEFSKEVPGY